MTDHSLLIAIPTYNRAAMIESAVFSLIKQANQGPRWRVLVVNNASSDDTADRLARIASSWPRLSFVNEPVSGSSQARNRAITECNANFILFTDDECRYPIDYVDRALLAIDERTPKIFGGPVYPWYLKPPPAWFRPEYGSYSLPYATGRSNKISFSGANIGFDILALRELGGFDVELGIHGDERGYGEETDIELRILSRFGPEAVWFDPEFFNYHVVLPEKFRWRSLLKEHFQRGVSRARIRCRHSSSFRALDAKVPECLLPKSNLNLSKWPVHWQNLAYERGLSLVRLSGYIATKLGIL